jgi:hypothetical protein
MPPPTLEIEGDTLEQAKERVKSQIPDGFHVLAQVVLRDERPTTAQGVADSIVAAFAEAEAKIPVGAVILERKEVTLPGRRSRIIEAADSFAANRQLRDQVQYQARILSIKLSAPGKRGFLGLGKRLSRYEAELDHKAVVEITYKAKAKISVDITENIDEEQSRGGTYVSGDTCPNCGSSKLGRARHGEAVYTAQCGDCGYSWHDY